MTPSITPLRQYPSNLPQTSTVRTHPAKQLRLDLQDSFPASAHLTKAESHTVLCQGWMDTDKRTQTTESTGMSRRQDCKEHTHTLCVVAAEKLWLHTAKKERAEGSCTFTSSCLWGLRSDWASQQSPALNFQRASANPAVLLTLRGRVTRQNSRVLSRQHTTWNKSSLESREACKEPGDHPGQHLSTAISARNRHLYLNSFSFCKVGTKECSGREYITWASPKSSTLSGSLQSTSVPVGGGECCFSDHTSGFGWEIHYLDTGKCTTLCNNISPAQLEESGCKMLLKIHWGSLGVIHPDTNQTSWRRGMQHKLKDCYKLVKPAC